MTKTPTEYRQMAVQIKAAWARDDKSNTDYWRKGALATADDLEKLADDLERNQANKPMLVPSTTFGDISHED